MENTDKKTVAAKISPEVYTRLKIYGFKHGVALATVAGSAIEEFLDRHEKPAQEAEKK